MFTVLFALLFLRSLFAAMGLSSSLSICVNAKDAPMRRVPLLCTYARISPRRAGRVVRFVAEHRLACVRACGRIERYLGERRSTRPPLAKPRAVTAGLATRPEGRPHEPLGSLARLALDAAWLPRHARGRSAFSRPPCEMAARPSAPVLQSGGFVYPLGFAALKWEPLFLPFPRLALSPNRGRFRFQRV